MGFSGCYVSFMVPLCPFWLVFNMENLNKDQNTLRVVFWVGGECLCGEAEKNKTGKHTQKKKTQIKKKKVTHKILIPEWICGKAEIP